MNGIATKKKTLINIYYVRVSEGETDNFQNRKINMHTEMRANSFRVTICCGMDVAIR